MRISTHNKFAKFATFVSLTARDAFSTRPLQRRYGSTMKIVYFLIAILIVGCSSTESYFASVDRECLFSKSQKEAAWNNVVSYVQSEYPAHSKFCNLNKPPEEKKFVFMRGSVVST